MKTTLKVGNHNINYISSTFTKWFGSSPFVLNKNKKLLEHKTLVRSMTDHEIFKEWNPEAVTLADVVQTLNENSKILKNGYANIFYIKDNAGVLRAVSVRWDDGGWGVGAYSIEGPGRWSVGSQVFSRFFDSRSLSSDDSQTLSTSVPSDLEKRVKNLETLVEKLTKIINI